MYSISIGSKPPVTTVLGAVALSICIVATMCCFGPDLVASAVLDHLGSVGARATGPGRTPVPGLTSVTYALAMRATLGSPKDDLVRNGVPRA
jgi:hypothetical protein